MCKGRTCRFVILIPHCMYAYLGRNVGHLVRLLLQCPQGGHADVAAVMIAFEVTECVSSSVNLRLFRFPLPPSSFASFLPPLLPNLQDARGLDRLGLPSFRHLGLVPVCSVVMCCWIHYNK